MGTTLTHMVSVVVFSSEIMLNIISSEPHQSSVVWYIYVERAKFISLSVPNQLCFACKFLFFCPYHVD